MHKIKELTCPGLPQALHFLLEVITDSVFAIWASVPSVEPFLDALRMEPMQARQYHILLLYFIGAHAYCTGLILLGEICLVSLCEFRSWQHINQFLRHALNDVFI